MKHLQKILALFFSLTLISHFSVFAANLPDYVKEKRVLKSERTHIIALDGTSNARDLGGYLTLDGKKTKSGVFIRSDDTDELTDTDIEKLLSLGVKVVIDLRHEKAAQAWPDKLANVNGIEYHHIAISEAHRASNGSYKGYLEYTGEGNVVKQLIDIIVNVDDGAVLFHCIGGKDRTGFLSMLLLLLANVDKQTIINNYIVSYDFIKERKKVRELIERDVEKLGVECLEPLHFSSEKKIISLMNYVIDNYGSVENYLAACGVSAQNIGKIKSRFVE